MEVDKNEWLDKPLDERIKAGRRQSDRPSFRRSRDVPMKDVDAGRFHEFIADKVPSLFVPLL